MQPCHSFRCRGQAYPPPSTTFWRLIDSNTCCLLTGRRYQYRLSSIRSISTFRDAFSHPLSIGPSRSFEFPLSSDRHTSVRALTTLSQVSSMEGLHGSKKYAAESNSCRFIRLPLSKRQAKAIRPSPPGLLASWLEQTNYMTRSIVDMDWPLRTIGSGPIPLPYILVAYLKSKKYPRDTIHSLASSTSLETSETQPQIPDKQTVATLHKSGYTLADIQHWAWIVEVSDAEDCAHRYLYSTSAKPTFLLLEVLRRPISHSNTFRLLLDDAQERLSGQDWKIPASLQKTNLSSEMTESSAGGGQAQLEETTFMVMICRLLGHARRLSPTSVSNIAQMLSTYFDSLVKNALHGSVHLDSKLHFRLSRMYNMAIQRLSLPASISPFKSMIHNWKSQRILLDRAGTFEPPLQLDRKSYQAVARVLGALQNTRQGERYSRLLLRSWPPWRVDADGMDSQRSLEDDASRVVLAISAMKESGYQPEPRDTAAEILGGREPDGTPTIPTRSISSKNSLQEVKLIWAARIRATRDVQEAWSAFVAFNAQPTHGMFHAMFEKLMLDKVRKSSSREIEVLVGEGKEVIAPNEANISDSELLRIRPPSVHELYIRMISQGIRPSGRCLDLLVSNANSIKLAIQYLWDSDLSRYSVSALLDHNYTSRQSQLRTIPASTFTAFIKVLCRFQSYQSQVRHDDSLDENFRSLRLKRRRHPSLLMHAMELLKVSQTRYTPAWYALFSHLAQREIFVNKNQSPGAMDAIECWKVMEAALKDAFDAGIELDPRGFRIICIGLEKALLASVNLSQETMESVRTSLHIVKDEFAKLARIGEGHNLQREGTRKGSLMMTPPILLHIFEGAHLHAYVRVLGAGGDLRGIRNLLKWMVQHRDELHLHALESRNGINLMRRTLVASRLFLEGADQPTVASAVASMNKLGVWGGWPSDVELEEYIKRRNLNAPAKVAL